MSRECPQCGPVPVDEDGLCLDCGMDTTDDVRVLRDIIVGLETELFVLRDVLRERAPSGEYEAVAMLGWDCYTALREVAADFCEEVERMDWQRGGGMAPATIIRPFPPSSMTPSVARELRGFADRFKRAMGGEE